MTTKPTSLTPPSRKKIDGLLGLEKITINDIENLNQTERANLSRRATRQLRRLKGEDRDNFMEKIELIVAAETKNEIWEGNHAAISSAISQHMRQCGTMPAKSEIAAATGLSRQTVAKHVKEYKQHPEFVEEMEQFKFMTHKILATVFKFASNGDTKAARLYFEMVGALNNNPAGTVVNEQNNYIQINNTILNQEKLKQLSAEQLAQIENIVTCKELKMLS